MGLKFEVVDVDLERQPNSRSVLVTLNCSTSAEAAALYDDLVEHAKGGEVKIRLGIKDVVEE